ncbi:type IV pilus modification PilV family protein [Defluviitalea phaphyphila]|uniref:type IV pilus modification PilV family protein n=1 Tax=Defluviitalea phaphyphila TaxID=1473580 RepID=UPI0007311C49|nr:prepilin-type N-terminal cleavage/methylation domain-containing protein [Defluviitalea phaphyphila]
MNKISQFLKKENQSGFSYIEVLIAMAIFAICIIPILSIAFSSTKNSIKGKKYYEAVIMAQNLSERIKKEVGEKLKNGENLGKKREIKQLYDFLNEEKETFNREFKGDDYNYEVYIKETEEGIDKYELKKDIDELYKFIYIDGGDTNTLPESLNIEQIIELNLSNIDSKYFGNEFESLSALKIEYDEEEWVDDISEKYEENITFYKKSNKIVVDNKPELEDENIKIEVDVSKLNKSESITIENNTSSTIILTIYPANKNIEIFPIQTEAEGNIFIERQNKLTAKKNYVIRIIVRDRKTSDILKEMIDIYSYSMGGSEG